MRTQLVYGSAASVLNQVNRRQNYVKSVDFFDAGRKALAVVYEGVIYTADVNYELVEGAAEGAREVGGSFFANGPRLTHKSMVQTSAGGTGNDTAHLSVTGDGKFKVTQRFIDALDPEEEYTIDFVADAHDENDERLFGNGDGEVFGNLTVEDLESTVFEFTSLPEASYHQLMINFRGVGGDTEVAFMTVVRYEGQPVDLRFLKMSGPDMFADWENGSGEGENYTTPNGPIDPPEGLDDMAEHTVVTGAPASAPAPVVDGEPFDEATYWSDFALEDETLYGGVVQLNKVLSQEEYENFQVQQVFVNNDDRRGLGNLVVVGKRATAVSSA